MGNPITGNEIQATFLRYLNSAFARDLNVTGVDAWGERDPIALRLYPGPGPAVVYLNDEMGPPDLKADPDAYCVSWEALEDAAADAAASGGEWRSAGLRDLAAQVAPHAVAHFGRRADAARARRP